MSNIRIVGRVAAAIAPGVAALASLLLAPGIASGRPHPCASDVCPPPPPPVVIDHSDIGTGGGQYPAPGYYPNPPTCADAVNVVECVNSGPW
jgi:hypothetical protein